jgi:hypothetical protein
MIFVINELWFQPEIQELIRMNKYPLVKEITVLIINKFPRFLINIMLVCELKKFFEIDLSQPGARIRVKTSR